MLVIDAEERIKTINRSLGQLRRRFIWNYERIKKLEAERHELQQHIAQAKEANRRAAWIWETA